MVAMLASKWMQERRVSAPGLLVLLTGSHVSDIAGRFRIDE
jgi:hypothetical protein